MPSRHHPSPPWAQDFALAVATGVAWFTAVTVLERSGYWYPQSLGAYGAAGAWIVVTLALRRTAPGPLFWATAALYPLTHPAVLQTPFELVPLVVAGFAATRTGAVPWPLAGLAGGLSACSLLVAGRPTVTFPPVPPTTAWLSLARSPSDVALALALVTGAVAAGVVFRRLDLTSLRLRERNAELQELQAELAEQAVLAERTRIARELHDVVAHHVSAIVVRAQAADRVAANRPDAPREAVRWIGDEGKRALTSMRSVVHVLRDTRAGEAGGTLAPTPGADDAPEQLRAAARRLEEAGRDVALTLPEPWPATSAECGLAVVRIAQEALTNVLLHSLAPSVTVTVTATGTHVGVRVHDPGPPLPEDQPAARAGFGLSSMRERALAAGGRLVAGPDERGGWVVDAFLPRGTA
ncbi:sensor histidine kinase [Cellulosimicrobium cellulans]|uniref:sensor histidine kinase n=1 Tax=Cellulosimicrobium cellulans TaxID=1710 RepID=UPI000848E4D2|nr:histidine kinase [Cellulosimicrobium cellulans]